MVDLSSCLDSVSGANISSAVDVSPRDEVADPYNAVVEGRPASSAKPSRRDPPTLRQRSLALRQHYRDSHDRDDIDAAIHFARQAIAEAGTGRGRPTALADLANALRVRFVGIGSPNETKDIDDAIQAAEHAVSTAEEFGTPRPVYWSVLSLACRTRYLSTQHLADLDRAVTAAQNAVDLVDPATPDGGRLGVLATSLRLRYARTSDIADANRAVINAEKAVAATPDDVPRRAARLSILASCRGGRYRGTRQLEDIDRAITAAQQALQIPDPHPRDRKNRWANLGTALRIRGERTKDPSDLNEAVTATRAALALTPRHDSQRVSVIGSLASALGTRYQHLHDKADADEALTLLNSILNDRRSGASARAGRHSDYGALLRLRAEQERDLDDARQAVVFATRATELVPAGSSLVAHTWSVLGSAHALVYDLTADVVDAEYAAHAWRYASRSSGSASIRLHAAYSAGKIAYTVGAFRSATDAFDAGVRLLPSIAWTGLTRPSQEDALRRHQVVVGSAASAWIERNEPLRAVEALERGRGVLWAASMTMRSADARLAEQAPPLADALAACAQQLAQLDACSDDLLNP